MERQVQLSLRDRILEKPYSEWKFEENGLSVYTHPLDEDLILRPKIVIRKGVLVGDMDFIPNGNMFYSPHERSASILEGLTGFNKFFKECAVKNPQPRFLKGATNYHMAKFALNLGFETLTDGLENEKNELIIFGKTEDVKETFYQRVSSLPRGFIVKLEERVSREDEHYRLLSGLTKRE